MTIELCEKCRKVNHNALGKVIYIPKKIRTDYPAIINAKRKGIKISEIAENFDLTPRRVWQILQRATQ